MSDVPVARYKFLPWVRAGYQPTETEQLRNPVPDPGTLSVDVTVEGEGDDGSGAETASLDIDTYGPGDVVGLDGRQVVRMEPEPHTGDFSPNYFPMVEFDRPDLPWLFSPISADGEGKLRPWLCLVVVEQQGGVELSASGEKPLPTLTIGGPADPKQELPDPVNSWAWAHSQVVGAGDSPRDELESNTTKTVSRLVAPRRLEPATSYHACVVPTFMPGRLAGLGKEPYPDPEESEEDGRSADVEMAWDPEEPDEQVQLPVYHSWEFTTSQDGDFESLVRELEPEVLDGIGYRDVDASEPGVEAVSTRRTPTDVRLEGALKSAELDELAYPAEMREELTGLVNADADPDGDGRPTFGPPVYGKYHADVGEVPDSSGPDDASWLRELNVDPRHRIAAGFGVDVVRDQQEQLMASAWDQVGEVRAANKLLRRAQLAREASNRIHDDLSDLDPSVAVTATAGMHDRARWGKQNAIEEKTFRNFTADSRLPSGIVSQELSRLLRPSGPIASRIGDAAPSQPELVEAFTGESPVDVERYGYPSGAATMTRDRFGGLCQAVKHRTQPSSPTKPLHDRIGADGSQLRTDCWSSVHDARQAVETMGSDVSDADAQTTLTAIARALSKLGQQQDGDFDESSNFLAGLDAAIADGDYQEIVWFLGAIARKLDAVEDGATHLERQADDLPASDATLVENETATLRTACWEFRSALAARAFHQLPAVAETVRDVIPAELPASERSEDVVHAFRAVCGAGTDPASVYTLVDMLQNRVSPSSHEMATNAMAEIRRLVEIATDRLADVSADQPGSVETVRRVCRDVRATFDLLAAAMDVGGADPIRKQLEPVVCERPPTEPLRPDPELDEMADALLDVTDPENAVPRRVTRRIGGAPDREDPLDVILAAPEFPKPMYEPLADLSQEYLLPGVGDVPKDSIGVLVTNPAFVRAYMVGLNHEMAREFQWREYPTDMRGTYFDQFWGAKGAVPAPDDPSDITDIHAWDVTGDEQVQLGDALRRDDDESSDGNVVLLVRGELLRRYPNTTIYAAKATYEDDEGNVTDDRRPDLPTGTNNEAPEPSDDGVAFPMFRGHLDSDMTFFGFDVGVDEARGKPDDKEDPGWFFVIEEAPGEPRLGLDVNQDDVGDVPDGITATNADDPQNGDGSSGTGQESGWSALSWGHMVESSGDDPLSKLSYIDTEEAVPGVEGWQADAPPDDLPEWGKNGAHMAAITWQKPVRIAIHADDMLPADEDGSGSP